MARDVVADLTIVARLQLVQARTALTIVNQHSPVTTSAHDRSTCDVDVESDVVARHLRKYQIAAYFSKLKHEIIRPNLMSFVSPRLVHLVGAFR